MDKLTVKEKLGYSAAAIGDASAYTFIGTFLMFFLTTVAGLAPAIAGSITAVGAVWNTALNPIIGYLSDHTRTKWGARRPFMFVMVFPLAAAIYLLFTAVDFIPAIKPFYYGAILIIFWTSYTGFFVPYLALGAEYTQDYNERTGLRSYAAFFNMAGAGIAMIFPTIIVDRLRHLGATQESAWSITGGIVGACTLVSVLITVKAAGKKDPGREKRKERQPLHLKKIFLEYWQVLKLRPIKYLLLTSLFFLVSYAMFTSNTVYFFTYNHGMSAEGITWAYLYRTVICVALIPLGAWISRKTDKRTALLIMLSFGAVSVLMARFIGISSLWHLAGFIVLIAICTSVYWQLMPAIIYDVCEYDELETGKRRQGAIVSIQGLVEALASGLGLQLLGIILQLAGFDGEVSQQTPLALAWVENCITIVPVFFILCAIIALYKYPITKARFQEIQEQLNDKKKRDKGRISPRDRK